MICILLAYHPGGGWRLAAGGRGLSDGCCWCCWCRRCAMCGRVRFGAQTHTLKINTHFIVSVRARARFSCERRLRGSLCFIIIICIINARTHARTHRRFVRVRARPPHGATHTHASIFRLFNPTRRDAATSTLPLAALDSTRLRQCLWW